MSSLSSPSPRSVSKPRRATGPATGLRLVPALLCLVFAMPASAQSLTDAVRMALQTSPRIQGSVNAARVVTHEIVGAQSQMNARYGVIIEPGYGYIRGYGSDGSGNLGVQATKPLYDSGKTDNEVARQRARLSAANHASDQTRAVVAQEVADAYIELVKLEALTALARDYVKAIGALNGRVKEIVAIDRGRGYDLLQTESRRSQALLTLANREGQLQEVRATLAQRVGQPVNRATEPPTPRRQSASLDDALVALDRHPAVLAGLASLDAARRGAAVAGAWDKPTISARGRVTSPEFPAGNRRWFGGYDVGLVTDWNPFDGGGGAARAAAANAEVRSAEEALGVTRQDLATEVSRHWSQIQARSGRTGSLETLVEGARRVRAAYWEQFQIGKRSILDLLNAENENYQAQVSALTEQMELLQVRYRLLGAQALLTDALGIQPQAGIVELAPEDWPDRSRAPADSTSRAIDRLPDLRSRQ